MDDHSDKLQSINDETVRTLIPAIIFIGTLMFLGIFGNSLVIYFYGRKVKPTPSYTFIVTLAVIDFIMCAVAMPLEIVDLVRFYTFENSIACKMMRYFNYFVSIASVFTLIAIATERYRKICRPFEDQLSIKTTKIAIGCILFMSIISASPTVFLYEVVEVNITEETYTSLNHSELVGYDCTTVRNKSYKKFVMTYIAFLCILFVITVLVLSAIYIIIGKQLYQLSTLSNRTRSSQYKIVKKRQITVVMLSISVVFVVSAIPCLSLQTWRTLSSNYGPDTFSNAELVAFEIGLRSLFVGSVCNPVIYGILNTGFQKFLRANICFVNRQTVISDVQSTNENSTPIWLQRVIANVYIFTTQSNCSFFFRQA